MKTHEKSQTHSMRYIHIYELEFSDNGLDAMAVGLSLAGEGVMLMDSQPFTKFCHHVDGIEFHYDMNSTKNVELETMMTRHKEGKCHLRICA